MNARPRLAVSYINIGRLYLQSGRLPEAEAYLVKAFALAGEVDERNLQMDAAEALNGLYEQKGDFKRAYEYQREYSRLKEQIFSKENFEKIATLQSNYESEKKQREIELLKKEGEIAELQVKRQRLWIVYIASAGLLLASLAVVLYGRYRLKARTNAALSMAYSKMADLARHDHLTGLYNRRFAVELLEMERVRMARAQRPFSVIILDVDDFKSINDTHGHECGDRVLVELGDVLRSCVREQDAVARWGGEEFLLMLPETDLDGAAVIAEKVRAAVDEAQVPCSSGEVSFTVTAGAASWAHEEAVEETIRRADGALLDGKRTGKNRVVLAAS